MDGLKTSCPEGELPGFAAEGGERGELGRGWCHQLGSPEGFLGVEDWLLNGLMWLLSGDLSALLPVGQRPQFLAMCISPQGCLSALTTRQLATDPRESKAEATCFVGPGLGSEALWGLPCAVGDTDQLWCRGRGPHKGANTRGWGLFGPSALPVTPLCWGSLCFLGRWVVGEQRERKTHCIRQVFPGKPNH